MNLVMHSSAEEVHKDAEYAVSLNSPHPRDSNIRSESEDIVGDLKFINTKL